MRRLVLALLALRAASALAADPGERCAAAKMRAVGQKAKARLQCYARALVQGAGPDAGCLSQVENRFATRWAKIEMLGGCATVGDEASIESSVDGFVSDIVAALPPNTTTTSTTVTATSTCPPTTGLYCGSGACGPFFAICPGGMTCTDPANGCTCVGDPVPCGNLQGALCQWGTCPAGMTCGPDPASTACSPPCACH